MKVPLGTITRNTRAEFGLIKYFGSGLKGLLQEAEDSGCPTFADCIHWVFENKLKVPIDKEKPHA